MSVPNITARLLAVASATCLFNLSAFAQAGGGDGAADIHGRPRDGPRDQVLTAEERLVAKPSGREAQRAGDRQSTELGRGVRRVRKQALQEGSRHGESEVQPRRRLAVGQVQLGAPGLGAEIGLTEEGRLLGHVELGMRMVDERAILVGGDLQIESRPGHGTSIRLTVPDRTRTDPRMGN